MSSGQAVQETPRGMAMALPGRWWLPLLVGVLLAVTAPAEEYPGDAFTIRLVAQRVVQEGRWDLPADMARQLGERGQYVVENPDTGRWYSKYGVLNVVLYLPLAWVEAHVDVPPRERQAFHLAGLNVTHVALSMLVCVLLQLLCGLVVGAGPAGVFAVVSALLASFAWNYLRAHTGEMLQAACALAWAWMVARADRAPARTVVAWVLWSHALLLALCMAKLSHAVLWPWHLVLVARAMQRHLPRVEVLAWSVLPFVVAVFLLGVLNHVRFGAAWSTGYTQWQAEENLLGGSPATALAGFLAHPQRSIFTHAPLLVMGALVLPWTWRASPVLAWLGAGTFVLQLLVVLPFPNWAGEWSYGPRYLLVPLLLFTPFAAVSLHAAWRLGGARRTALAGALVVVMAWSAQRQLLVNTLPFFAYYRVMGALMATGEDAALAALKRTPFPDVNAAVLTFAAGGEVPAFMLGASGGLLPRDRVEALLSRPGILERNMVALSAE